MKNKNLAKRICKIINDIFTGHALKDIKKFFRDQVSAGNHNKMPNIGTGKNLENLVESKIPTINRYNIKFNYNIINDNDLGNIDNKDFILAIDDLLENAINLCKKVENKNYRWIKLDIYRENMYLFIDVFNSANSGETASDSKYSIKHLKKFLKKYDGILHSFSERFNTFYVEIQVLIKDGMINMDINESKKYLFKGIPLYDYISKS